MKECPHSSQHWLRKGGLRGVNENLPSLHEQDNWPNWIIHFPAIMIGKERDLEGDDKDILEDAG
jgi:hypothetical protein